MGPILFAFITVMLQGSSTAFAETFTGLIKRSQHRMELLTPSRAFDLVADNSLVARDIQKLKSGDYLQGFGAIRGSYIAVKSIDFVGLREFLGRWQSQDHTIIDVSNFKTMRIYLPKNHRSHIYNPPVEVEYAMAPQDGDLWSILLNTQNRVEAGAIELEPDQFTLLIADQNQSQVSLIFRRIEHE